MICGVTIVLFPLVISQNSVHGIGEKTFFDDRNKTLANMEDAQAPRRTMRREPAKKYRASVAELASKEPGAKLSVDQGVFGTLLPHELVEITSAGEAVGIPGDDTFAPAKVRFDGPSVDNIHLQQRAAAAVSLEEELSSSSSRTWDAPSPSPAPTEQRSLSTILLPVGILTAILLAISGIAIGWYHVTHGQALTNAQKKETDGADESEKAPILDIAEESHHTQSPRAAGNTRSAPTTEGESAREDLPEVSPGMASATIGLSRFDYPTFSARVTEGSPGSSGANSSTPAGSEEHKTRLVKHRSA